MSRVDVERMYLETGIPMDEIDLALLAVDEKTVAKIDLNKQGLTLNEAQKVYEEESYGNLRSIKAKRIINIFLLN